MIKNFSLVLVLAWMFLIFYLSHQPATISNELSLSIVKETLGTVEKVTSTTSLSYDSLNHLLRKNAHFIIYLVLGVLVANAINQVVRQKWRLSIVSIIICFFYAILDEIHQHFVDGRGPQVKDVFIDSLGAIVGISLFYLIYWLRKKIGMDKL